MTNLKKQAFSALAAGSMVFAMAMPAFAQEMNLTATGNGADSNNTVKVENSSTQNVVQDNKADFSNDIKVNNSTGGNSANKNTGGDVRVNTGDASTTVNVSNTANSNQASLDCCQSGNTDVTVSGNGADSNNKVKLDQSSNTKLYQTNDANIKNNLDLKSSTGKNDADKNTGGDVRVITGDATTDVAVSNAANMNSAKIGGGNGTKTGAVSALISGNGADSYNNVDLDLTHKNLLTQANAADLNNSFKVDQSTGKNDANRNTGGDVIVYTGDADAMIAVDNMANFNAADLDCGCLVDLNAKIAKNGADSDNKIAANLDNTNDVFQNNDASLKNKLNVGGDTGYNNADENTGGLLGGDPSVWTGDSATDITAANTANVNSLGKDAMSHMPNVAVDFNLSLSLSQLKAFLGL